MGRLPGRVAIVTGGASGIGQATATLFAKEGARVVIGDRNDQMGEETAAAIRGLGGEARFVHAEITRSADVRKVVKDALDTFGRLDVVVNNAAIAGGDGVLEIDEAGWDQVLAVVLKGPFLFIQAALPAMQAQGSGSFVNIASVNGLMGLGEEAYSAAKAGLINLTQNVATRYGRQGIRANAICPGTVHTPIWQKVLETSPDVFERLSRWYPLGRVGEPEDIARAALFLASDEASWITGAVLPVDGGLTAGLHRMAVELQGEGEPGR